MKRHLLPVAAALALLLVGNASAVMIIFDGLNRNIPDGNPVGLADTQIVNSDIAAIGDLNVWLNISGRGSGGFNGDLYVTLVHESGFTVLLNRPGRQANNPIGYGDNGLNVVLDDEASANVHAYRLSLLGSEHTRLSGPLTGTWIPDGRNVDPDQVVGTTPVTTSLSAFDGLNPNGAWTLYVADVEYGGLSRLDSWGLEINGAVTPVPESGAFVAELGLVVLVLISLGHRQQRANGKVPAGRISE